MDFEPLKDPRVILATALLLIIARAVYRKNQATGRPPTVSYLVPWVGSAIDLGKCPDDFFRRAVAKHGDIFRVKAFGRTLVYVTSPHLIAEIYRDPKIYDFPQIRKKVGIDVFMMDPRFAHAPMMGETMFPTSHKLLSPLHVQPTVDKFISLTYQYLEERADQYDGLNIPLRNFIVPLTFDAANHAFFGKDLPVEDVFRAFVTFDNNFHLLLAGVPRMFMKGPVKALDEMITIIERYFSKPGALDDASEMVQAYERIAKDHGFDDREAATLTVGFLWALQANSPFAAYWIIALNLPRENGLQPLAAEVDKAVAKWNAANPSLPLDSPKNVVDFVNQAELPLLSSTIQETLRSCTSVMSIRAVMDTTELAGYRFDRGDEIVCVPRMVHLDPEIHDRPDEYIPTRYMTYAQNKFSKNGKPVINHSMPWGGGVSMCEGRHFAQKEVKALITLLLMKYTIEADPKSTERPTFMVERMGVGVMHPRGDIRVIIRRR